MAETVGSTSSHRWTSTQAYIMAVVCLLIGAAVGYLLRGSVGSNAPAPATAGVEQQGNPHGGMGGAMGQQPTPEQMKQMADKQAEPLLQQLKSKPDDPATLAQVGDIYYDAQVFPVAIEYYQKSLALNAKNAAVRTDMGTAMFYSGDFDHAISEFNQALKDDPKNGNALFNRGIAKWQGKMDVQGAVEDWEKLLKENPNYEQADKVKMYITQAKKHAGIKPGQKTEKPAM